MPFGGQSSGRNAATLVAVPENGFDLRILTIPFPAEHNSSPFSIDGQLRLLVHAARNLMHEQDFCHKVSLTNF